MQVPGHLAEPLAYARSRRAALLADLQAFVRIPSVSAQPQHAGDVRRCAEWLARRLRRAGLERVTVVPTPRHPIVFAEWRHATHQPAFWFR